MKKDNKKGFTLVELLAVIIILAIILVIAVPQLMETIEKSRKSTLELSAKKIALAAEALYISNQSLGKDEEITCSSVSDLSSEDYESCDITFNEKGEATVVIVGKGQFEGLSVCGGTRSSVEVIEGECAIVSMLGKTLEIGTNGLEKTDDGNVRYTGSSPNNYVAFNDELWRIIGVFEVETASGAKEKLVKIVRNESLLNASWDSSASTVNSGYGVNEWSEADLKVMLNDYYYGTSSTCTYCNDYNQETCINDCTSTVAKIGSTYKEMIESVVWNTGAAHPPYIYDESGSFTGKIEPLTVQSAYEQERGTKTGNYLCDSSSTDCTDTVTRTTEWIGRVGLIYPSDYGYASTDTSCRANIVDYTNYSCKNNNWLHNNTYYWLLSPIASPGSANSAWRVRSGGGADFSYAGDAYGVRPSIYLKSEVLIESGLGTSSDPYILTD